MSSETSPSAPRTGGQILVDQLVLHGVQHIFCVPGESYLAVLDDECTDHRVRMGCAPALTRDYERAERYVEMGIAQGRSLVAADRMRVALAVLRGTTDAARVAYEHMLQRGGGDRPGERARAALTHALLLLQEGDTKAAVRESLRALQAARADADARGEAAALKTLSACYQVLARPDDAAALSAH